MSRSYPTDTAIEANQLLGATIRELNERWPETLTVLAPLGIDLCCGGGHALGTALELHGIEPDPVIEALLRITEAELR